MAGDGAVLIRDLLVGLGVAVKPGTKSTLKDFDHQIDRIKRGMEDASSFALRLGASLAAGITASIAAVGGLAVSTGQHALAIERAARGVNLTREEYQKTLYLFEALGANHSDLADTLLQINGASQRAIQGSGDMVKVFASLGVQVDELKGKNPSELMDLLAERISNTTDKAAALAAMSQVLGEEASRKLGPALLGGANAFRELKDEAVELGIVMSDQQISVATAAGVQWRRFTTTLRSLRNEIGAALAPVVTKYLKLMVEWVKVNREWLSQKMEKGVKILGESIKGVLAVINTVGGLDNVLMGLATGAGLLTLIANISRILEILGGIRVAFSLISAAAATAGITSAAAFWPVTIAVAAAALALAQLYLVLEDIYVHFQGGKSVVGTLMNSLEEILPVYGDLRDLLWAVAQYFLTAATMGRLFMNAVVDGMIPGLTELLDRVLDPLLGKLEALMELWKGFNEYAGRKIRPWTEWVNGQADDLGFDGLVKAGEIESVVSHQMQGQVESMTRSQQGMTPPGAFTVNQTNAFSGVATSTDVERGLESVLRKAAPAVKGGRR